MNNKSKMIEVYVANGELEARVIQGMLESAGITCLLQACAISSLQDILVPGLGGFKVMVAEESADKARGLIKTNGTI